MGRTPSRVIAWIVVSLLPLALAASASATISDHDRASEAMAFVIAHQKANGSIPAFSTIGSTADAVVDMAAIGAGGTPRADAVDYLRRQVRRGNVTDVGAVAKVIMAAEASGHDAAGFGGKDLLATITTTERASGRFAGATVFDQALAILALRSAALTPDDAALKWLAGAQCPDGGWQFNRPHRSTEDAHCQGGARDYFASDTNTTAYAVMALAGTAVSPGTDPFPFFDSLRDPTYHGWGYTWGFVQTDANSTSLVIQAYAAESVPLPLGAMAALRDLQYRCGAEAYSYDKTGKRTGRDVGASIGAVLGFLREPLPVIPAAVVPLAPSTCPA